MIFLTHRTQQVCLGNSSSDSSIVTSGVPQGSVLGPLLFLIYINDLKTINPNILTPKFADDVKLYTIIKNDADYQSLSSALLELELWSETWGLPISGPKCKSFHIGKKSDEGLLFI